MSLAYTIFTKIQPWIAEMSFLLYVYLLFGAGMLSPGGENMFKHTFHAAIIWILIFFSLIIFAIVLFLPLTYAFANEWTQEELALWRACQNREVIRLHVVANSNSEADQATKMIVRDAIIDYISRNRFQDYSNTNADVLAFLNEHLAEIESFAAEEAIAYGYDGAIKAEFGDLHLPEKAYGNITLPAGEYSALRITIGAANGENWWCVLFPNLCSELSASTDQNPIITFVSARIFRNWLLHAK